MKQELVNVLPPASQCSSAPLGQKNRHPNWHLTRMPTLTPLLLRKVFCEGISWLLVARILLSPLCTKMSPLAAAGTRVQY